MSRTILKTVTVIFVIAIVVVLSFRVAQSDIVQTVVSSFGYPGVFIVSVLSGFSVAVPIPTVAFLPIFLGAGFSFWPLLVVMSLGMSVGDALGYFIGNIGRQVTETRLTTPLASRVKSFIESFRLRHRLWPYVLLGVYVAFIPAPNEILVIPMAFLGYRFLPTAVVVLIGNFVFNTLVALGIMGLASFF